MSIIVYRLRLFGREVASWEIEADLPEPEPEDEEDEPAEISGGSGHNFERDGQPLAPDDRYRYDWDGSGFGRQG